VVANKVKKRASKARMQMTMAEDLSFYGCHFCELFLLSKSVSIMEIKLKGLTAASAFCLNACKGAGSWVYVL